MTAPSTDLLLAAHEDAPVGLALVAASGPELGRVVRANRALCRMLGYEEDELLTKTVQGLTHPDDLELDRIHFRRLVAGEIPFYEIEKRVLRSDGEVCWIRLHAALIRDEQGAPRYTASQVVDITPLKRTAAQLAGVIESSLDAIVTADAEGKILEFNPAAERLFGHDREHAIGRSIDLIVPEERRGPLAALLRGEDEGLLGRRIEVNASHADGSEFPVELAITRIHSDPDLFAGFIRDLRPERAAQQALADSERRYRSIVETTTEGVWMIDRDERTTFVNPRMADMLGYEPGEMLGRPLWDFMDDEGRAIAEAALARRREGVRESYRSKYLRRDGSVLWASLSADPLLDEHGNFQGSLALVRDVTDRLRAEHERAELESRLHQAQRLETVGQLAGGVAHDFNNLLSVIEGYADYVAHEVADRPGAVDAIEEIRRAAERAAALTRQLLTFSRRDLASPETVDLRDSVKSVRRLLGRTLGKHVELSIELPEEPMRVTIDVHQFEQVLLNLAVNSRDAMSGGGRLVIALRRGDRGVIELVVSDNGGGMPRPVVERAFDPFFTTKPPGQGTGLGLATVYGIVTRAGGEVSLESRVGKGTRVVVRLPEAPEPVDRTQGPSQPEAQPARGQTILLVEDEAAVRLMAARILRRHGYDVVEAEGAEEALGVFRGLDPRPDLILTDVAMPRMSGVELAARLGKASPPVVFMSGYTDESVGSREVLDRSAGFLQKPFSAAALLHRVGEALAGRAEPI